MRWVVSSCWQARLPARRRWRLPSRAWLLRCSGWAVLAIGSRKRDGAALEAACRKLNIGYLTLGDAAGARRAMNATREAFDAALRVDDETFMQDIIAGPKTVFVTGATGTMGQETVKQLLARSPRFKVRVLARPSDKNRALLKKMAHPMLEVVWGDMADFACVKRCVAGSDYVLHIGAMVSPAADKYPEKTLYTNIGSTLAIIKAIQEQPNADDIHLVYVGTVAETGDRQYPVQMGRCGDPINPSIHDYDEPVPPAMRQARVCAALRKRELLKTRRFWQLARKHGENFGKKRENWTVPALLTRFFYEMLFHPGFVPVSKRACIRLYTML